MAVPSSNLVLLMITNIILLYNSKWNGAGSEGRVCDSTNRPLLTELTVAGA